MLALNTFFYYLCIKFFANHNKDDSVVKTFEGGESRPFFTSSVPFFHFLRPSVFSLISL